MRILVGTCCLAGANNLGDTRSIQPGLHFPFQSYLGNGNQKFMDNAKGLIHDKHGAGLISNLVESDSELMFIVYYPKNTEEVQYALRKIKKSPHELSGVWGNRRGDHGSVYGFIIEAPDDFLDHPHSVQT